MALLGFKQTKNKLLSIFDSIKGVIQSSNIARSAIMLTSMYIAREFIYYYYRKWYSLPPGPNGYPFFGCIFHLMRDKQWLVKMATHFGPIFMVTLFNKNMIFISDATIIKHLFIQKDLLNRRYVTEEERKKSWNHLWSVGKQNTAFLLSINGDEWQKRRKHAQTALFRTMTTKHIGSVLKHAIESDLIPYLNDIIHQNKLWFPRKLCQYLAFNTLYHTMFGSSIERNSALYKQMVHDFDNTFAFTLRNNFVNSIKPLQYIKAFAEPLTNLRNRRNETIATLIKERITNKSNKEQETYIDLTHKLVENGEMRKDEEIADALILFMAGTDTTSSTLDFGIVLIAKNRDVQVAVRKELFNKMDEIFDFNSVHNCPLFRALVFECIRISSVAYMGVQHVAIERDHWVTLNDGKRIRIPAKTALFTNMDYIHIYNKGDDNWKHCGDDRLCLANFLDDDGYFKMNDSFVGFGVGRRDCIGRQLAIREIQYILGFILMNYELSIDQELDILKHRTPNMATVFMSPSIGVRIKKI